MRPAVDLLAPVPPTSDASPTAERGRLPLLRYWRWLPLIATSALGLLFIVQTLRTQPSAVPIGATATVSFEQGPPMLMKVGALSSRPPARQNPGVHQARFYVTMRLKDPATSLRSGDALASYCSALGRDGRTYPASLRNSDVIARRGIFDLSGNETRAGEVVAFLPARVQPEGVACQLGDDIEDWIAR